jgi:hypothetical protein
MKQIKNRLFFAVQALALILGCSLGAQTQDASTNTGSAEYFKFTREDFEGDGRYSKFVLYKGKDVDAQFDFTMEDNRRCLALEYGIKSFNWDENYLTIQEVLDEPAGFSEYSGLTFWLKSDGGGGILSVALMDENNNSWEYSQNIVLDTKDRWIKMTVPFSFGMLRDRKFSRTNFNWARIKTIAFGVALPGTGVRTDVPLTGKVFLNRLELRKKTPYPRTAVFNYLPKSYFLFEYYTDKEMPIISDRRGKDYGIYMTFNWQDALFFADQFSLNWKVAIPTHFTLDGKDLKQTGEVYQIAIPGRDPNSPKFSFGLKELYLLYAPYSIMEIKKLRLGTQNFKWSDLSVFSTDQLVGLYWQGVVKLQTTMEAFVLGNFRNDKYFAGIRMIPQLDSMWKLYLESVYGMQYLKGLDSQGNAVDQRVVAQDYSLFNFELKGDTKNVWVLDKLGLYAAFATMWEKDYGGITQLTTGNQDYVFIKSWDTPLDLDGIFCRAGTAINIEMFRLLAEYRIMTSGFGGSGYQAELMRWCNDAKADLLMTERRRDLSLQQWKYRRLMRNTYDNQKGIGLDLSCDMKKFGILELTGDYSSTFTGQFLQENRSMAGYRLPWTWLTPMLWWRWEQATDAFRTVLFDTMYYEVGLTSSPLPWVQLTAAYQYSWDVVDSISKNVYFGEIRADVLPNISLQFRIKFSDHPHINEDLAGLVNSFRHDDIREYIDHMPDTYVQILMKILM